MVQSASKTRAFLTICCGAALSSLPSLLSGTASYGFISPLSGNEISYVLRVNLFCTRPEGLLGGLLTRRGRSKLHEIFHALLLSQGAVFSFNMVAPHVLIVTLDDFRCHYWYQAIGAYLSLLYRQ